MAASQQERCGLSGLSMCREVAGALGGVGRARGQGFLRGNRDRGYWREGSPQPQFPEAQSSPQLEETVTVGSPHESQGSLVREGATLQKLRATDLPPSCADRRLGPVSHWLADGL